MFSLRLARWHGLTTQLPGVSANGNTDISEIFPFFLETEETYKYFLFSFKFYNENEATTGKLKTFQKIKCFQKEKCLRVNVSNIVVFKKPRCNKIIILNKNKQTNIIIVNSLI